MSSRGERAMIFILALRGRIILGSAISDDVAI
jgi:hypothetical protein